MDVGIFERNVTNILDICTQQNVFPIIGVQIEHVKAMPDALRIKLSKEEPTYGNIRIGLKTDIRKAVFQDPKVICPSARPRHEVYLVPG
jgi:hypothetical protein